MNISSLLKISFNQHLKNVLCAFFLLLLFPSEAQNKESIYWNFGDNADLYFEFQQNPYSQGNSAMNTDGGSTNISDINGNLLFYSNSENVWNKDHNIMPNGNVLLGNSSYVQNSIAIPIIGTPNIYYLFTIGENGLYYSVIDMSLDNSNGDVSNLNIPLLNEEGVSKISAVHHSDGQSIWLMVTKKNPDDQYTSFYCYKISPDGLISPPVITDDLQFVGGAEGILKFSPNGNRLAVTNFLPESVSNHFFLFKFNKETGVVFNKTTIFVALGFFVVSTAYGIEFSNDSNYLYALVQFQGIFDPDSGNISLPDDSEKTTYLHSYDLSEINPNDDISILDLQGESAFPGSLQLAIDGKIYRSLPRSFDEGTNFVGVINNPNNSNNQTATYSDNAIDLGTGVSRMGLPNFVQSYFRTRILNDNICRGETANYEVDTYANITSAEWDFGDGNFSNSITPNHTYTEAGDYQISATITVNNRPITTTKRIRVYDTPNLNDNQELIQCDTDTDGISIFNLNNIREKITDPELEEILVFYESLEDAEQDINPIENAESYENIIPYQTIFVRAINQNGCHSITSFTIIAAFVDLLDIPDFYICEDSDGEIGNGIGTFNMLTIRNEIRDFLNLPTTTDISFFSSLIDAQTIQDDIRASYTTGSTTIWVRADEEGLSCSGLEQINLIVNPLPQLSFEDNYVFCGDTPLTLSGHQSNDRFEWLDENGNLLSTFREYTFDESGTYTHISYKTINGLECSASITFDIEPSIPPFFENVDVQNDYNNNTIYVEIGGNSNYEFSTDNINFYGNSSNYTFFNIPSGIQKIYVRDINQCENVLIKEFYLIGYPKFFTPNNDGINDYWRIKGAKENSIKSIQIFNRFGKLLIELNSKNAFSWDGFLGDKRMPTNDYWFKVNFIDGHTKVGHFTLKN